MSTSASRRTRNPVITMIVLLLAFASTTFAACNTYTPQLGLLSGAPNDQFYTASAQRSYVVSNVVNCTGSPLGQPVVVGGTTIRCNATTCGLAVESNYLVNIESELNVTTTDDSTRNILALVKRSTSQLKDNPLYDFNRTMTISLTGSGVCISEGQEAYYGLTPVLVCTEGILSGCSGTDSPANNTAIRACGASYFSINSRGIGQPSYGANVVMASGFGSRDAPPNATVIVNSNNLNLGSSVSVALWSWVVVGAAAAFALF